MDVIHDMEMERMKLSENGLKLIKKYEGCRLKAYKATSSEKYYTIGYGHYSKDITADTVISLDQAEQFLKIDVAKAEADVNRLKINFTQNQFDALVSFTFNCGSANLKKLCNNRNKGEIGDAITLYTKAGGKELKGLVLRRREEQALYFKNDIYKIAEEVIAGKWGNGSRRKTLLFRAGYDYNEVQNIVNKLIRG